MSLLRLCLVVGAWVAGAALTVTGTSAQINTGEIAGVVRDITGAPVPDARITATHPDSGTTITRVADREGRFFLPALRIGRWDLVAALDGAFAPGRLTVTLEVGRTLNVEFALGLRGLTESVQVAADLSLLQTTTAEISDVIENREVVQLPINGRSLLSLAQLSDAVVIPPAGRRPP